jgi:ABC-type proline/glycine betaine transport system permease subunit
MDSVEEEYGRWRLIAIPLLVLLALGGLGLLFARQPLTEYESRVINFHEISMDLSAHLFLAIVALVISLGVGLPLGIVLSRSFGFVRTIVFTVANLSQAIPSPSVLALAYIVIGSGQQPAILALAALGLLPVLRNTVVGLGGIDPAVREAAKGMGMSTLESLLRVELPLAAPVIFAGIRTTLVLNISSATLATFIGGGGLGDMIASGIDNNLSRVTLVGATIVASLAILADWAAGLLERRLVPRT